MKNAYKVTLWNGKSVPRLGIGTWVMGGEQYWGDQPTGWSGVSDAESIATLLEAFDMGIRIIDTADQYGAGHAEKVIAQALRQSRIPRDEFVLVTKVGMVCDESSGNITGITDNPKHITDAIDASLKRLRVEHIDMVKFHLNGHPIDQSEGVFEALQRAYDAGKVDAFGWSNDEVVAAMAYAKLPGYKAVQHDLNLFSPASSMLKAVEKHQLWSFNRQPLAMGLLTGKYNKQSTAKGQNDVRGSGAEWLRYFDEQGRPNTDFLDKIEQVRRLLTHDGRSLAQGALGWVLAQSSRNIPLPGCRTPAQAKDNFAVLDRNAVSPAVVADIDRIMTS